MTISSAPLRLFVALTSPVWIVGMLVLLCLIYALIVFPYWLWTGKDLTE